ncbi:MAG: NAD(P)H-hydrate dehydratase [Paludibacter sp.]
MKLFNTENIRSIDQLTIKYEPVSSISLMERAATAFYNRFKSLYGNAKHVYVFCGPGNNGGDALAVARMLKDSKFDISVFLFENTKLSDNCLKNKQRILDEYPRTLKVFTDSFDEPVVLNENSIIIDGLFGSGLTRPISGVYSQAVQWINNCSCKVVSIDIPSGLYGDIEILENQLIVKADITLTFQFPKLSFFMPESACYLGQWESLDIGLDQKAIESINSDFELIEKSDITKIYKHRNKFSHKGTYGHALIIAGSKGMAGASVLAAKAALRSGAGLVTLHGPECNRVIVQTVVPELIFNSDKQNDCVSTFPDLKNYNTIGIGCGIGTLPDTCNMIEKLFTEMFSPCVIDADALNVISRSKHFMDLIPEKSILTPHPKEFDRLFGSQNSSFSRLSKAREIAKRYHLIIVLKGTFTTIITSDGKVYFNNTGNSGLATAGTGDVLTGILTSLLAQGYSPENAACMAVFLHGKAAELSIENQSEESLIAGDIIENLGKAFHYLSK